jgi:hypothetical protein
MPGQPGLSATTTLHGKPRATGILSKIAHMPFVDANRDVASADARGSDSAPAVPYSNTRDLNLGK